MIITPKNRDELINLINTLAVGAGGEYILAEIESYALAIVPVDPTYRMLLNGTFVQKHDDGILNGTPVSIYRAMVTSSPFTNEIR